MNEKIENIVFKGIRGCRKLSRKRFASDKIEKILVLRIDHLGDMVCTIPFIRELRKNYPNAEIDLLCSAEVYNYVELNPYVNKIIKYSKPEIKKHVFERTIMFMYRFAREHFKDNYYDIVFTPECPTPATTRILAHFIRAKKVVSFVIEDAYFKVTDTKFSRKIFPVRHTVENCLDLLTAVQGKWNNDELEIWADDNDKRIVDELLAEIGVSEDRLKVVMFISTSADYKDWAVENYAKVAEALIEKYHAQIILLGAKSDTYEKGKVFMKLVPKAYNLIGRTTIRQTGVIIKKADVYLGGDTGTLHLAAACKINGVVITKDYEGACGSVGSAMDRFYPWHAPIMIMRPNHPLAGCEKECMKTYAHCINQITPDEVFQELSNIIENTLNK